MIFWALPAFLPAFAAAAAAAHSRIECWTGLGAAILLTDSCLAERAAQHVLDTDDPEAGADAGKDGDAEDPEAAEDNPESDPVKDPGKEKMSSQSRFKEFRDHQIATGLSIMFLGMIFLVGFVAWLIAYPDKQVRHYCVRIVSSTVVIFMAIAIDHASIVFTITEAVSGLQGWKLAILPFFSYWMLTIFASFLARGSHLNLNATTHILSHVSAFVAISGYSDILYKLKYYEGKDDNVFSKSEAMTYRLAVWLCACAGFWCLLKLSGLLLRRLPFGCEVPAESHDHGHGHSHGEQAHSSGHGHEDDGEDTPHSVGIFIEEVEEALEEASLVACSYLFVKFVVCTSLVEALGLRDQIGTYEQRSTSWRIQNERVVEAIIIMVCEVVLLNLVIIALDRSAPFNLHKISAVSTFLSMCMAWSSMRLVRCLIMLPISEENCILILTAFTMTPMAGLLVVAVDKLADMRTISEPLADTFVTSYGFMIGFSWEKAFASASNLLIGEYFSGSKTVRPHSAYEFWVGLAICGALVLIMFPGWRFLILPVATQPLPPRFELKEIVEAK